MTLAEAVFILETTLAAGNFSVFNETVVFDALALVLSELDFMLLQKGELQDETSEL